MLCVPTASAAITVDVEGTVSVATPPLSVPVPRMVAASLNVTVPLGVPTPGLTTTVAVKVTAWPNEDGLAEDANFVVVPSAVTAKVGELVARASV